MLINTPLLGRVLRLVGWGLGRLGLAYAVAMVFGDAGNANWFGAIVHGGTEAGNRQPGAWPHRPKHLSTALRSVQPAACVAVVPLSLTSPSWPGEVQAKSRPPSDG